MVSEDPSAHQRLTSLSQIGDMFSRLIFGLNPDEESFERIKTVLNEVLPLIKPNALNLLVRHTYLITNLCACTLGADSFHLYVFNCNSFEC